MVLLKNLPKEVLFFVNYYYKQNKDASGWQYIFLSTEGDDYFIREDYVGNVDTSDEMLRLTDTGLGIVLDFATETPIDDLIEYAHLWRKENEKK